ncbi:MAG: hypothetical protein P8H06_00950 [Luminiphilus sp.]|jgi:hypothetical protein|nr:hypothetical protein [Luminiphilus sp.]
MEHFLSEDWMTQDEWYQTRGSKLFANRSRWDWFFRKHREEIVSLGCIGLLGRNLVVKPSWLENAINDLVVIEAQRRLL